jgi:uncharacterized protein DUF3800
MPQTIFCDEAGFTGNNLLDPAQPFFTYAALAIDPEHASSIVASIIRDFGVNGKELKGQRLLRSNRGRQAVSTILKQCAKQALVSAFHKRYSLASKFFEYIFEPVLAQQSSIYYDAGFHRFVSNVIYFEAMGNNQRALTALNAFQAVVRECDVAAARTIFPTKGLSEEYSEVLRDIETFTVCHHDLIAREIGSYTVGDPLYSWLLDLSVTALFALMTTWGERFDSLVVYCDESKPLHQNREAFDMMIGRTDRAYITFENKRQSLIFNLAEPLHFVSSKDQAGIQLADVFASALGYALRHRMDRYSTAWLEDLDASVSPFSVFPEAEVVDLREERPFVNRMVLRELVERSLKKQNLFKGMRAFMQSASDFRRRYLLS